MQVDSALEKSNSYPTLFGCMPGHSGNVVVVGVPYDRGSDAYRAGCAEAPERIRQSSGPNTMRKTSGAVIDLATHKVLFTNPALSDLGNIRFRQGMQTDEIYLEYVSSVMGTLASEGKKTLTLGGDHLVTLAVLRGYAKAKRKVQVVQIDAHHDYGTWEAGEIPTHGTFMSFVAKEGLASRVIQVGVRGLAGGEHAAPPGFQITSPDHIHEALEDGTDVYLTVDTDGFDPSIAPGVSYPEPEGLSIQSLSQIIEQIRRNHNIVGSDWMEFNPRFDTANGVTGKFIVQGLARIIEAMN